tara:strand:- start:494 stop:808 length:315 start_codon:yes stop_codon:yes gene_type:complete
MADVKIKDVVNWFTTEGMEEAAIEFEKQYNDPEMDHELVLMSEIDPMLVLMFFIDTYGFGIEGGHGSDEDAGYMYNKFNTDCGYEDNMAEDESGYDEDWDGELE